MDSSVKLGTIHRVDGLRLNAVGEDKLDLVQVCVSFEADAAKLDLLVIDGQVLQVLLSRPLKLVLWFDLFVRNRANWLRLAKLRLPVLVI